MSKLISYFPFDKNHCYAEISFQFHPVWYDWLTENGIFQSKNFKDSLYSLMKENQTRTQIPEIELWFAAFKHDPRCIRVVILGKDPYPTRELINNVQRNMATGYSFDISPYYPPTGSLRTIYVAIKEQYPDARIDLKSGDLTFWKGQGVFLLNKFLTVGEKKLKWVKVKRKGIVQKNLPKSYPGKWNLFTDTVLGILSEKLNHVVFILWGSDAVESEKFINLTKHEVLKSYHPSSQGEASGNYQIEMLLSNGQPLSMNLFSQETHFLKVNRYLTEHGLPPVDWSTLPKP